MSQATPAEGHGELPRRGDEVTLHEVESDREGTRYVLKHEVRSSYIDLPLGDHDAFVWARLDGATSLEAIGRAYLDEFGTLHPDLSGLVQRLRAAGFLAEPPLPPTVRPLGLGGWLASLGTRLAMVRLPIPLSQPLWRQVGRLAAPLYATPVAFLAAFVALAGLLLPLTAATPLPHVSTSLLDWPTQGPPGAGSLLLGLLVLLLLNAAVDLFEAVAQVALLARGKRPPGRIGLSFDLLVPGIYIETPDEILLPLELRARLLLAPFLSAALVGGLAMIGWWGLGASGVGLVLLHKLAWVAWLRAAVHLNPLGPGPFHDALRSWWGMPRLRKLAWRFLRLGPMSDGEAGYSRRELTLLGYLLMLAVYFVFVAQLGSHLLSVHIVPEWNSALGSGGANRLIVLALLGIALAVPTLLALLGGALLLLQAGLQALSRTEWFTRQGWLAASLAGAALVLALSPRLLGGLGADASLQNALWVGAAAMAVLTLASSVALVRAVGIGWGALDAPALGLAGGLMAALWALVGFGGGRSYAAGALAGCLTLGSILALYSWSLLETFRWIPTPSEPEPQDRAPHPLVPRLLLAVSGVVALVLGTIPSLGSSSLLEVLLLPAVVLCGLTALLIVAACWQARGSQRAPGLILMVAGLVALSACWSTWWSKAPTQLHAATLVPGGIHLPFLAAALLAGGCFVLWRAHAQVIPLPPFDAALDGETPAEHQISAASFLLDGLAIGLGDVYGPGTARAVSVALEREGLAQREDDAGVRAHKHRVAVVRLYRDAVGRTGHRFMERVLDAVVARFPALAQERFEAGSAHLLPGLGEIEAVPHARRRELVRGVVHFTDFDEASLDQLADWVGLIVVESGTTVIRQGDEGDRFYMLARGQLRVLVEDNGGVERAVATLRPGDAFGEAALLQHELRSASVVAEQDSLLLVLEREVFAAFLRGHTELIEQVFARQDDLQLVREVPLFADLSGEQVTALCRRFVPRKVPAGETIIRQGDAGDRFYLIREGEVEVRHRQEEAAAEASHSEELVLTTLQRGDYFGEIALLEDTPRTATVTAKQECELLSLEFDDFHSLVHGTVGEELARRTQQRLEEISSAHELEPYTPSDPEDAG